MELEIVPAHEVPLHEQARLANSAFAGYVGGWADLSAETLARFLTLQGADLFYSRFVRQAGRLAGFGYINRTGNILRLAGMGIIPDARRTGAAAHLVDALLREASERGDEAMMLEVIEQNPRAHAVYRRHGFHEVVRLLGWRRTAEAGVPQDASTAGEEVPILDALRMPTAQDYPELPWQISRHAVAKAAVARAFRTATVCVIVGDPEATPVRIYAAMSIDPPRALVWRDLRSVLAGVLARFPHRDFFAPAIFPEEFGRQLYAPLGFKPEPISQFLMR
ncbi:MAG TPA: GNAT family N-acetyltransferase, partial [Chthoniobacterales bacterium]|nr:GNAT family N-acetyltransferase [Chthoniobacterales bacterium]